MPPLEQRRFSVSWRSYDEARRLAEESPDTASFDVSELGELQFIAGRPALRGPDASLLSIEQHRAAALLTAIADGEATAPGDLERQLPKSNVTALRMGPVRLVSAQELASKESELASLSLPSPHPPENDGYARTRIGMSFADGPAELWSSARGYWRMSPDTEYLVPTRFGYAPYVFKTEDWSSDVPVWAQTGWLIDPRADRLVRLAEGDAKSHWLPRLVPDDAPASPTDLTVARLISGKVIGFGRRGPNPIIRLRSRTRRVHPR